MEHGGDEYPICAVCDRSILRGERPTEYVTPNGERALVCPLCKGSAEAAGWIPAARVGENPEPPQPRRASRLRLRERFRRVGAQVGERRRRARRERQEQAGERDRGREQDVGSLRVEEGQRTPERAARLALEYFNATDQPRKVAGLSRSLGEPQVCVHPLAAPKLAEIAVAWELSWYRWEVLPSGEVRQIARGDEVAELPEHLREWNASVGETGVLRLNAAP
jgi:hypothetical protein